LRRLKKMEDNKKKLIPIIIIVVLLIAGAIAYFVLTGKNTSEYFNDKTTLNERTLGITLDVSNKSVTQVQEEIQNILDNMTFTLTQGGEVVDEIVFKDANVVGTLEDSIARAKKMNDQISGLDKFKEHSFDITIALSITEDDLNAIADDFNCLNSFKDGEDAYIIEENYEKVIVEAQIGTITTKEKLVPYVVDQFNKGNLEINLDDGNIYEKPETSTENKELVQKVEIFNKSVNTNFTYTFGEESVTIPKETIYSWITLSDTNKILFDDTAMAEYIRNLAKEYNTIKMTRTFITTDGEEVTIPAKTYGWKMDETKELAQLKSDITKGGTIAREPVWSTSGYGAYTRVDNNDFGKNYIEVDLSLQKMYVYVDGEIVITTDIVSGTKNAGHLTSCGAHKILSISRDVILTGQGEDAEGEVGFAYFFDGQNAIHDTALRTEYGGDVYVTDGTRGCVNIPYTVSKQLYDYVEVGYPVVIHD
jgi:uncharacterized protein YneF (UPF0154 family)